MKRPWMAACRSANHDKLRSQQRRISYFASPAAYRIIITTATPPSWASAYNSVSNHNSNHHIFQLMITSPWIMTIAQQRWMASCNPLNHHSNDGLPHTASATKNNDSHPVIINYQSISTMHCLIYRPAQSWQSHNDNGVPHIIHQQCSKNKLTNQPWQSHTKNQLP